jgi:hypothetical protein
VLVPTLYYTREKLSPQSMKGYAKKNGCKQKQYYVVQNTKNSKEPLQRDRVLELKWTSLLQHH